VASERTEDATGATAREVPVVVLVALVLALVTSWPLPVRLTSHVPEVGFGDPYIQAWQVAWGGHALATQPLDYFQANVFWPNPDSLAFSDALIGYAPMGLVGTGSAAAIARYNLLFLFAYVLPFVGAYLLARELGAGRAGSFVAAAAFAYAPFRSDQATHLHVISSGGIPLALFALLRGYRRAEARWVLAGCALAAWQVGIGFTLGLQLGYLLGVIALWALWRGVRHRALPFHESLLIPTVVGGAVFLVLCAAQAAPYLRVAREHVDTERTREEVELFSPPVGGLLTAPEGNRVWGKVTAGARDALEAAPEQSLFPGAVVLVLAATGAVKGALGRRARIRLAAATVLTTLLALGTNPWFGDWLYGTLFRLAPGWSGVRTPGRLMTLASLGLALLATFGAEVVRRSLAGRRPRVAGAVAGILVIVIVVEGAGTVTLGARPVAPDGLAAAPAPQLHLPSDELNDRVYTLWSADGFPDIANGLGAFPVRSLEELRTATASFPDEASVDYLRAHGIRSVVFHPQRAPGTPWQDVLLRPLDGLGITSQPFGEIVIFRLDPAEARSQGVRISSMYSSSGLMPKRSTSLSPR
jgi:hypothetical protein